MTPIPFKVPTSLSDTPLSVAKSYIAHGVPCFPCHEATVEEFDPSTGEFVERPEKSPYTPNGLKGASRSERVVGIWFGDRYPGATIGVPTGEQLGAWVLDLDRHGDRDGHVWLAEMEALHGKLPETARARTANGGTHIFFTYIPGLGNRAAIAPGVDTRSEGGYILAPGSVMADGRRYEWIDADGNPYTPNGLPDFAETPQWLVDLLKPKVEPAVPAQPYTYRAPQDVTPYVERALTDEMKRLGSTGKGQRGHQLNASAFSVGQLVGAGHLERGTAEAELYAAAVHNGLLATDGERKVRSAIKRGLDAGTQQPRQIPDLADNDNTRPVDTSRLLANGKAKREGDTPSQDDPAQAAEPRKRERFELTWFDQIEEGKPKETIVKGVLGESEFTVLSGLPGTGKSVIVTDMACHIAAGMEWHGRRVRQGLVVYIAAERKKLTERRMMAFRKRHGVQDVPLLVVGGRLDLTKDLVDANALIALVQEAEIATGLPCVLLVIDTLTRVFGAGDQNTSKDMTRFVQSCDQVLADTKAHVLVIHHTAWAGERMKGAIDLDGAVDATFLVKKDHGKYKLVCNGTNDGEEGDLLAFKMDSVVLGHDEDGEPTTAPVVVPVGEEVKMTSGGATGISATVLAALGAAMEKDGVEPDGPAFPDGVLVVKEDEWRAAYYAAADGKEETVRKRFNRGKTDLLADGLARQVGQWFWVA